MSNKSNRKGVSRHSANNKKSRIARRDGRVCAYCGGSFRTLAKAKKDCQDWRETATLDHYVPYSKLRGWRVLNLVLACDTCNNAKGDEMPVKGSRWHLPYMNPLLQELIAERQAEGLEDSELNLAVV